ncbi:MAG: ABC transporter permease, partial [Anaerolineales bacterium]
LLFRLMFPTDGETLTLSIVLWDPGNSRLGADLRSHPQVQVLEASSADQVADEVAAKAVGGLLIPQGFDVTVDAGDRPELVIFINQRHGGGEIAAFQQLVVEQVWSLVDQDFPAQIVVNPVAAGIGMGGLEAFQMERFLLIMLLIMALAMAGSFMVPTLLVEEKEKHTLEVLLVAPASAADVAAGKAITGMVYSLLGAVILLVLYQGWSGNWILTLVVLFLGALFTVGVGLLMGALFRNTNQVNTWSSLVMLLLIFPTWVGIIGPVSILDIAVKFIPTHYLAHSLQLTIAGNVQFSSISGSLAVLVGSVVAIYAIIVWAIGRERG